jgi:hypothetical protein
MGKLLNPFIKSKHRRAENGIRVSIKIIGMATANYKLTIGPLIDTIFKFKIGGKNVNVKKLEGSLKNVSINEDGIEIQVELGGSENAPWSLNVDIEDQEETFKTKPPTIKGKIAKNGGSRFNRTCPLKKQTGA